MTTNKLGTVTQKPLYGCTSCYEECVYPADHLRVNDGECWCDLCWDERRREFPDQPSWNDLEPYTPAVAVPVGWKLVPEEIIDAMVDASGCEGQCGLSAHEQAQRLWSALLAVAPSHSQQSTQQIPECFKKLTRHAVGMCFGADWNNGTAATIHRENVINSAWECDKYLSENSHESEQGGAG